MTLPQNGKKLTEIEKKSMKIALKEADIRAIHPKGWKHLLILWFKDSRIVQM